VDFLFQFTSPHDGAMEFRAIGIAIGYLLFAGVFLLARNLEPAPETADYEGSNGSGNN